MTDIIYLTVAILFYLASLGLVLAFERLLEQ
jgi:hypothetical protein